MFVFRSLVRQQQHQLFIRNYSNKVYITTMSQSPTICTHSGNFHADEALACYLLKLLPKYKESSIIRTRDNAVIDKCDIVVDVGATYDHSKCRYDHHQAGFTSTFDDKHETKLSSAGLIYKHYGKEIIKNCSENVSDSNVDIIYHKLYDAFIEELDGVDNGVERYPSDIKPKYQSNSGISARVGHLNPLWNEPQDEETITKRFYKAMELIGEMFVDRLHFYSKAWLPARDIVLNSIEKRSSVHPSGEIMVLDQICPWKDHLYHLESELKVNPTIKFVLFGDNAGWRVQAVNQSLSSFALRIPLFQEWRGKRDEELSKLSGIDGCVFCHANGFIGGNKTKEGALEMAVRSLNAAN
ncbi:hypothetical protein DLAC_11659 [Tieghemostelium lacteum]|uniref:Uncharacterized protein n=1 Tax=Tieghemostelium lacteum TaxID=361077 RepID=A0A151ZF72_TIELA|nr:hypothetical protein DLAC_11659 [Tieghemostelium lacteum]|eukprot:KYQ92577.1 hypothetical protein DLAC_11659 [Tieghemostelium lacteum]